MPAATLMSVIRTIISRRDAGESYASIARGLAMSYHTVRKVDQHYRRNGHLEANYAACQHTAVRKSPVIYQRAIQLKSEHPSWGGNLIWVELADEWAESELPSVRTLQRWFHRGQVARRRPERTAKATVKRGQAVHEVWAIDAKEGMQLLDGSYVSWLTISDEASGAVLRAKLFPHPGLGQPGAAAGTTNHSGDDEPVGKTGAGANG